LVTDASELVNETWVPETDRLVGADGGIAIDTGPAEELVPALLTALNKTEYVPPDKNEKSNGDDVSTGLKGVHVVPLFVEY
jgi:hypothetical protein